MLKGRRSRARVAQFESKVEKCTQRGALAHKLVRSTKARHACTPCMSHILLEITTAAVSADAHAVLHSVGFSAPRVACPCTCMRILNARGYGSLIGRAPDGPAEAQRLKGAKHQSFEVLGPTISDCNAVDPVHTHTGTRTGGWCFWRRCAGWGGPVRPSRPLHRVLRTFPSGLASSVLPFVS